jgi:hypothetical protein
MKNNLNPTWKDIIGANNIVVTNTQCLCTNYVNGQPTFTVTQTYTGQTLGHCPNDTINFRCEPVYNVTITERRSDGFILEESAKTGPGANLPSQLMPGSNHLQMRNDSKTSDAMDEIFIKGLGGTYFQSPK